MKLHHLKSVPGLRLVNRCGAEGVGTLYRGDVTCSACLSHVRRRDFNFANEALM
jgi:hypothetical protein